MEVFPPNLQPADGETQTGLICPDCGGSVTVKAEARHLLVFRCRVGHLYTLDEMLLGKETHIEQAMWAAVYAYAEMAAFLRTLEAADGSRTSIPPSESARRARQADEHLTALRQLIERDRQLTWPNAVDDAPGE